MQVSLRAKSYWKMAVDLGKVLEVPQDMAAISVMRSCVVLRNMTVCVFGRASSAKKGCKRKGLTEEESLHRS